jgi:hypothetical protein
MSDFHSAECVADRKRWKAEHDRFLAQWPNCCRTCHATGEIYDLEEEPDFCSVCISNEECPRCSSPFIYRDANSRCPTCGWEMGEEFLDWPPDCDCDEQMRETLEGEE